jgi:hypothetical protein
MSKNDIDERSIYDIEPNCEVIGEPGEYDEFKIRFNRCFVYLDRNRFKKEKIK